MANPPCSKCASDLLVPAYEQTIAGLGTFWLCVSCYQALDKKRKAEWIPFGGFESAKTVKKLRTIFSSHPAGNTSLAAAAWNERRPICECEVCAKEGQHEPTCAVHDEPPRPCDCPKTLGPD